MSLSNVGRVLLDNGHAASLPLASERQKHRPPKADEPHLPVQGFVADSEELIFHYTKRCAALHTDKAQCILSTHGSLWIAHSSFHVAKMPHRLLLINK